MIKRHWLTFLIGILAGLAIAAVLVNFFFPNQTKQAVTFSLSTAVSAEQTVLSKPLTFFSDLATPQSVLTQSGVVTLTNQQRTMQGLKPLTENPLLDQAAAAKAQDMFTNQYFDHISPNGKGPSDLATAVGYSYILIGENLALGDFANDADLIAAWMASPGHRANILNVRYQDIGVAVMKGQYQGKTVWMAVQEFGLPASACPAASATLKQQITSAETTLDQESSELAAQKAQIDSMSQGSTAYQQAASQYNELVNTYNALVTQTKALVTQYNGQVNTYNTCAQG